MAGGWRAALRPGCLLIWLLAIGAAACVVPRELNEVFDSVLQEAAQILLPDILEPLRGEQLGGAAGGDAAIVRRRRRMTNTSPGGSSPRTGGC